MAKIKKIPIYPLKNPLHPNDYVIGTDALTGKTKNFTLGQLINQDYNLDNLDLHCLSVVRRTITDCEGVVTTLPIQPLDVLQSIINAICNIQEIPVFDLLTNKTVSNSSPLLGETFIYTITVQNRGNINATGVLLNDLLPSGLVFVSSNTNAYNPTNGLWTVGNVNAGTTLTLNISVTLANDVTVGQTITNTITSISSDQSDTVTVGDNLSIDVTVIENQSLRIDAGYNRYIGMGDNQTTLSAISRNTNVTYLWEQISNQSVTISNSNLKETIVSLDNGSDFEFKITMTDNISGVTTSDTVKVLRRENSVSDNPIVTLSDQNTTLSSVTINGSYTDPQSLTNPQFQWTFQQIGSTGTTHTIVNENIQNVTINDLTTGVYIFRLTVTNSNGFVGEDAAIIQIT
jgi:uncharacterized repeat protein (TIGR01451 family)